jgi:uncharacterized protein (DUF305 family)
MQGMIGHHAQAIVMAKMCPSHDASAQLRVFCDKVIRSQRDEIDLMQTWLRDHGEAVPDPDDPHSMHMMHMAMGDHAKMDSTMKMDGTMAMSDHEMLMPGMLTQAQLAELDRARGTEFDRLFLTDMIRHHRERSPWSRSCSIRQARDRRRRSSGTPPAWTPTSAQRLTACSEC